MGDYAGNVFTEIVAAAWRAAVQAAQQQQQQQAGKAGLIHGCDQHLCIVSSWTVCFQTRPNWPGCVSAASGAGRGRCVGPAERSTRELPVAARSDQGSIDERTVWIAPRPGGQQAAQPGREPLTASAAASQPPDLLIIDVCRVLLGQPVNDSRAAFEIPEVCWSYQIQRPHGTELCGYKSHTRDRCLAAVARTFADPLFTGNDSLRLVWWDVWTLSRFGLPALQQSGSDGAAGGQGGDLVREGICHLPRRRPRDWLGADQQQRWHRLQMWAIISSTIRSILYYK